jgi:predicted transcriptional regulator
MIEEVWVLPIRSEARSEILLEVCKKRCYDCNILQSNSIGGFMSEESTNGTITIRTSAEILAALGKLAESMDRPRNWVIEAALQSYIDTQAWQVEGIKEALASLDRGDSVSHEDMVLEIDKLLATHGE